ncbi:MAG: dihydrofolate reductase family protein, partial [Bacteroidota bacterium]
IVWIFRPHDHIKFTNKLKDALEANIWLVGGGQLNTLMLDAGLIDEILLFQMPVVLGKGLPLFPDAKQSQPLKLLSNKSYTSGVTLLHYQL